MPDDKTESAPADRSRINAREEYEVQYWTKKFGCTPAELEKGFALRPLLITPSRAPKIDQVAQKRCNSHYGLYLLRSLATILFARQALKNTCLGYNIYRNYERDR